MQCAGQANAGPSGKEAMDEDEEEENIEPKETTKGKKKGGKAKRAASSAQEQNDVDPDPQVSARLRISRCLAVLYSRLSMHYHKHSKCC